MPNPLAMRYAMQRRNQGNPVVAVQGPPEQGVENPRMDSMHRAVGQLVEKILGHPAEPRMAEGGDVVPDLGPQEENESSFLEPADDTAPEGSQAVPDASQHDPASDEERDEQESGKVDLKTIMSSLRKKHRGGK